MAESRLGSAGALAAEAGTSSGGAETGGAGGGSSTAGAAGVESGGSGAGMGAGGGAGGGGSGGKNGGGASGAAGTVSGGGSGGASMSLCGSGGPVSNFAATVTNYDDELRAEIMLQNNGGVVVPVCQLSARYYFTADAPQVTVQTQALGNWPDTLSFVSANISATVQKLDPPTATATHYVEIKFTDSTTTKLAQYNWVRVGIQVSPKQTQQTDDYSYAGPGQHDSSMLVTVYRSGHLISGKEPQ